MPWPNLIPWTFLTSTLKTLSLLALMSGGQSSGSQIGMEAGGLDLRYSPCEPSLITCCRVRTSSLPWVALCVTHSRPKPSRLGGGAAAPTAPEFQSFFLFVAHLYSIQKEIQCYLLLNLLGILPCVGVQHIPPQDVPLLCVDFFELKTTKTLWAQDKFLCPLPPLTTWKNFN